MVLSHLPTDTLKIQASSIPMSPVRMTLFHLLVH